MLRIKRPAREFGSLEVIKRYGLIFAVALTLVGGFAAITYAESENVARYSSIEVDIHILANSDMEIIETQKTAYISGEFHYGYRCIPWRESIL